MFSCTSNDDADVVNHTGCLCHRPEIQETPAPRSPVDNKARSRINKMPPLEIVPSPELLDIHEHDVYSELGYSVDPLEIAAGAIAKLREHGLPGYIGPQNHPALTVVETIEPSVSTSLDKYLRQGKLAEPALVNKAKQGDELALEAVWLSAQGLAEYAANHYSDSILPREDRMQVALAVVPGVVDRYDASHKASFKTFLKTRMLGAIKDEERKHFESEGLSRTYYIRLKKAVKSNDPNAALHELHQSGYTTASHLVTGSGGISSKPASLDEMRDGWDTDSGRTSAVNDAVGPAVIEAGYEGVAQGIEDSKLERSIEEAVGRLDKREQEIIKLYYGLHGSKPHKIREIAGMFGVTESRISQLHVHAIQTLGNFLAKPA